MFVLFLRAPQIKCCLYILDVASRDSVESQQKGAVLLNDPNGVLCQFQNRFPAIGKLDRAVPTRIVACHHYLPDFMALRAVGKYILDILALHASGSISNRLVRHKFYVGYTNIKMKYHLLGYGIPIQYIPSTDTGKIKLNSLKVWLKTRAMIESGHKDLEMVECPSMYDVIFRSGQSYKKFHGNDIMRELIESELVCREMNVSSLACAQRENNGSNSSSSSSSSSSSEASIDQLCYRIIREIEINRDGRFLKWANHLNVWVKITDRFEIKKKIAALFYNYSRRNYESRVQEQNSNKSKNNTEDGSPYKFVEGGKNTTDLCSTARVFDDANTNMRKKPRGEFFNN